MLTILHTHPLNKDFQLFINCVEAIYSESLWGIKKAEKIPTTHLRTCIVVLKDKQPTARASIFYNPDLMLNEKQIVCVGSYECINDETVARFLHQEIEIFCRTLDINHIIGPMNGSTWENYRFNYKSEESFFTESVHPDYYNDFFEMWGMHSAADYFSSKTTALDSIFEGIEELKAHFANEKVVIRKIDLENYETELENLHSFLSEAFQTNFLYTPIEKQDFIAKYLEYKPVLNSDFVLLAEDSLRKTIGVIFCIEDLLNQKEKSLIIKTIARHPDKKWRGIGHLMGQQIYTTAHQKGFKSIIHAFMKEGGTSSKPSDVFFGKPFKKYRLYEKTI